MRDDLDSPAVVMARLQDVDEQLAQRQNLYESAARDWYRAQRDIGKSKATALLTSDAPSVTEKKAQGDLAAYDVEGAATEAEYESLKAVIRVLEQRSMILMALLKSHGRA